MSVCVNISGTAFSLLLYENVRKDHDQEGFLLGEILRNEKRTITDNDQEVVTIEHTIRINSVLPCPRLGHFFDNAGKVDAAKVDALLGDKKHQVVSWYKFKRISAFKLTLREKIVMKQLALLFMPSAPDHFTWCLLTARAGTDNDEKHIFSQTFIRYHMSAYQSLPMHIANLKDPHDVYKKPETCSTTFAQLVRALPQRTLGYATIERIETALDERIARTVRELEASEAEMHQLERRVQELRRRVGVVDNMEVEGPPAGRDANDNEQPSAATPGRQRRILRSSARGDSEDAPSAAVQKKGSREEQCEKPAKEKNTNLVNASTARVMRSSPRKS